MIDITGQSIYNTNIANINPFGYRGYYYDVETGFYYLNSRYYDPSLGRFINADDISYANASLLNGLNLYAYCGNNPIVNVDENGSAWWHWLLGIIAIATVTVLSVVTAGAVGILLGVGSATISSIMWSAGIGAGISGIVNYVSQGISSNWKELNFGELILTSAMGGISGGISGTSLNVGYQILTNIFTGMMTYLGVSAIKKTSITIGGIISTLFLSTFAGLIGGHGAMHSSGNLAAAAFWKEMFEKSVYFDKVFKVILIKSSIISTIRGFIWSAISEIISRKVS